MPETISAVVTYYPSTDFISNPGDFASKIKVPTLIFAGDWKGWWGDNPPYHVPVFILTHHARPPIEMEGDTTFHFITGGIREALDRAREAAAGMDVRIGGGPDTIQQYLREGLIDELHIAIAPVLLGRGEPLFEGVDLRALGYECVGFVASEKATHVVLRRQGHTDA